MCVCVFLCALIWLAVHLAAAHACVQECSTQHAYLCIYLSLPAYLPCCLSESVHTRKPARMYVCILCMYVRMYVCMYVERILVAVRSLISGSLYCNLVPPTPRLTRRARVLKMYVCPSAWSASAFYMQADILRHPGPQTSGFSAFDSFIQT